MSILFNGTTQFLNRGSVPTLTFPFAIGCWVYVVSNVGAADRIFGFFNSANNTDFYELYIDPVTGALTVSSSDSSLNARSAAITTGFGTGQWVHLVGQFVSGTSVESYVDGSGPGTPAGSGTVAPTGLNRSRVAQRGTLTAGFFANTRVAELTVWNNLGTKLSAAEIAQLATHQISPLKLRTDKIIEHSPFILNNNPTQEIFGNLGYTPTASPTAAAHPIVLRGTSPWVHTSEPGADVAIGISNLVTFGASVSRVIEVSIGNTINFNQAVWDYAIPRSLETEVTFQASVAAETVLNRSLQTDIFFPTKVNKTIEDATAINTVTFSNEITRGENPDNTATFSASVTGEVSKLAQNQVTFDVSVTAIVERTLTPSNTITFQNDVIGVIEDNCDLYEYTPFGSGLPAAPTLTLKDFIRLSYMGTDLDLRNPNFGDTVLVDPRRTLNRTRGGTLRNYRRTIWPKSREFTFTVSLLTEAEKDAIISFYLLSLGQEITYLDPEDRSWIGVLVQPANPIREQGRICSYEAEFVFRGVPV